MTQALVIGGGPAGLMACERLLERGCAVVLAEAKPSVGRKFLMAGKSGLNLTKAEALETLLNAYDSHALVPMLRVFGPQEVQDWARGLGQEVFTGSTGRVFPKVMKASPLLRAWLARLDAAGLERRTRWVWRGWQGQDAVFDTADGPQTISAGATVFAMGGGSWARLGSDGAWQGAFSKAGIPVAPFAPSNTGLQLPWSAHMAPVFGLPLKSIHLRCGQLASRGEIVISAKGLEGGGLYPLSPALRRGESLFADLLPDLNAAEIAKRLARPRGKMSRANQLRKALRLDKAKLALIHEILRPLPDSPDEMAKGLKALRVPYAGLRPLDEAISTVGGLPMDAVDDTLMIRARPGCFAAGEMLDWDAPTGGYLLTACLATGAWAGTHAAQFITA